MTALDENLIANCILTNIRQQGPSQVDLATNMSAYTKYGAYRQARREMVRRFRVLQRACIHIGHRSVNTCPIGEEEVIADLDWQEQLLLWRETLREFAYFYGQVVALHDEFADLSRDDLEYLEAEYHAKKWVLETALLMNSSPIIQGVEPNKMHSMICLSHDHWREWGLKMMRDPEAMSKYLAEFKPFVANYPVPQLTLQDINEIEYGTRAGLLPTGAGEEHDASLGLGMGYSPNRRDHAPLH